VSTLEKLISIMEKTRAYLALESNDYSWSSWMNASHALAEIDSILMDLQNGSLPEMDILFAPTGPIQEVSLSSGRGDEFLDLAGRFDEAYRLAKR
jgi:hypothetical protein